VDCELHMWTFHPSPAGRETRCISYSQAQRALLAHPSLITCLHKKASVAYQSSADAQSRWQRGIRKPRSSFITTLSSTTRRS